MGQAVWCARARFCSKVGSCVPGNQHDTILTLTVKLKSWTHFKLLPLCSRAGPKPIPRQGGTPKGKGDGLPPLTHTRSLTPSLPRSHALSHTLSHTLARSHTHSLTHTRSPGWQAEGEGRREMIHRRSLSHTCSLAHSLLHTLAYSLTFSHTHTRSLAHSLTLTDTH